MFDNRIDINGYRKDSMDRFGDDSTELILSFFTLEDKSRLEYVSKQWKRYIFGKQFCLKFGINSMHKLRGNLLTSEESFESVLKKFPNIMQVNIFYPLKSESLSLIGQYCHRLRYLYFTITGIGDLEFAQNYGHRLEELHLIGHSSLAYNEENIKLFKEFLTFCPNLKTILIHNSFSLFNEDIEFLPHLERIESEFWIRPKDVKQFKSLIDKYSQSLKTLYITLEDLNPQRD